MSYQLGSHVKWSSKHQVKSRLFDPTRKSKISNLDIEVVDVIRDQKNVLGLNVTVRDVLQVHIVQAKHYLMDDVGRLRFRKAIELGQSFEQFATLDELRDHIVVVSVFDEVYNPYDVGMGFLAEN